LKKYSNLDSYDTSKTITIEYKLKFKKKEKEEGGLFIF